MKLSKTCLTSAALSLALTAGAASPAFALETRRRAAPSPACSALTVQLAAQISGMQSALAATTPNPADVVDLLGRVYGDINALTSAGCLPAVPPTGAGPITNCVPDTAKLLSDVYTMFTALTKSTPDATGALSAVTALLADLTSLAVDTCLPLQSPNAQNPSRPTPDPVLAPALVPAFAPILVFVATQPPARSSWTRSR
jgi:hypothetical protein